MVFRRSALFLLSLSLLYSTVVYGEVTESLPPIPSHLPAHPHNHPVSAPTPAPHHHHHHHNHPASAPTPAPHHHHHPQAPAHAPVPHPASPPKNTPKPPSPTYPANRSLVAVQGVVYCKSSCKYAGHNTLYDSSALPNATVSLRCNNTKIPQAFNATTDKNGYLLLLESSKNHHQLRGAQVQSVPGVLTQPGLPLPYSNQWRRHWSFAEAQHDFRRRQPPVRSLQCRTVRVRTTVQSLVSLGPFSMS